MNKKSNEIKSANKRMKRKNKALKAEKTAVFDDGFAAGLATGRRIAERERERGELIAAGYDLAIRAAVIAFVDAMRCPAQEVRRHA